MRYLLQGKTGQVFIHTDILAKRADMAEIPEAVAKTILANKAPPVQEAKPDPLGPVEKEQGHPVQPADPVDGADPQPLDEASIIMAFDDKVALEEYARAKGLELDRRKSLANLKQEVLAFLGYQTEG